MRRQSGHLAVARSLRVLKIPEGHAGKASGYQALCALRTRGHQAFCRVHQRISLLCCSSTSECRAAVHFAELVLLSSDTFADIAGRVFRSGVGGSVA